MDIRYFVLQRMLKESKRIIDLGCGTNPVSGAVVAVDYFVESGQRALGHGSCIDQEKMQARGIKFVNQRMDTRLPFEDKEFDFAYSHHAFEHLDDPATACSEMMRIAKSGAIITPSIFSELAFGRSYHQWLVIDGEDTIFFFKKRAEEDRPFGEHPKYDEYKGWYANENTNPFDIALNDGNWYCSQIGKEFNRLRVILRKLWSNHSPVIENIFLWRDSFKYIVIDKR